MASGNLPPRGPRRPGPWPATPNSASGAGAPAAPLSWAKRTGFKAAVSGESNASVSGQISLPRPRDPDDRTDLEAGKNQALPPPPAAALAANGVPESKEKGALPKPPPPPPPPPPPADNTARRRGSDGGTGARVNFQDSRANESDSRNGQGHPEPGHPQRMESGNTLPQVHENDGFTETQQAHMNYELRDTPGLVPILFYGLQHYLCILGSLILVPLVLVPAMGGDNDDTSKVVSTVLFISGITTLLHTSFGTRLPLIQGPSVVFLAPALAIVNSLESRRLNGNNFRHIMRELQGALIISSAFQAIIGYAGLTTLLLRLISPVVVSSTIAAIGISFYSYGFTLVGTCIEIGLAQILLVVIFSLHLRRIHIFGHRIFLIYAVPLSLAITWAIAFLLTESGVYSYKGCDTNIPSSNTVSAYCREHVSRMKHCRADTSHALKSSPWIRIPLPLQWGIPIFNWKMALVMCAASIIASVDSVGSYHASSLFVASRPPTAGVVSRGIGTEGFCSILAALWGTGTGSTTLTENVHTIAVTRLGSRRAIELGATILILLSFVGKVGGFIASIPDVMVAALLCFIWAMLGALGFSNLRYSAKGSSRNHIILGLSLFFSLSVPAYFQQYGLVPNANSAVPSYFQPYIVESHGPFHTGFSGVNYVLNILLSSNMIVAFLLAVILDNTVPGSRQERGVYEWSEREAVRREPTVSRDYELPFRVGRAFRWVKWVGL